MKSFWKYCLLRRRIRDERCMAYAGVRLSKMVKHRTWVTTSPGSADFLLSENTSEGQIGSLATFPIVLTIDSHRRLSEDNILATLEHHDRVCQIEIWNIPRSLWDKALPLMQKPFPILSDLSLRYTDHRMASVIPDSFLGGSAPRL